jgi:regulator of replication initiation timing
MTKTVEELIENILIPYKKEVDDLKKDIHILKEEVSRLKNENNYFAEKISILEKQNLPTIQKEIIPCILFFYFFIFFSNIITERY